MQFFFFGAVFSFSVQFFVFLVQFFFLGAVLKGPLNPALFERKGAYQGGPLFLRNDRKGQIYFLGSHQGMRKGTPFTLKSLKSLQSPQ